jgi:hypothetical protein
MSQTALEQTVRELESRVKSIERTLDQRAPEWQRMVSATQNDTYFAEAIELGAEWRREANQADW